MTKNGSMSAYLSGRAQNLTHWKEFCGRNCGCQAVDHYHVTGNVKTHKITLKKYVHHVTDITFNTYVPIGFKIIYFVYLSRSQRYWHIFNGILLAAGKDG